MKSCTTCIESLNPRVLAICSGVVEWGESISGTVSCTVVGFDSTEAMDCVDASCAESEEREKTALEEGDVLAREGVEEDLVPRRLEQTFSHVESSFTSEDDCCGVEAGDMGEIVAFLVIKLLNGDSRAFSAFFSYTFLTFLTEVGERVVKRFAAS